MNSGTYGLIPIVSITTSGNNEEAKVLIEQWRREYNQIRPHSSLGYQPPAPEAIITVGMIQRVVSLLRAGQYFTGSK
jgi:hypothetical protein